MASERPAPLDLTRPRVFGELLTTTLALFREHAGVFLTLALVLVAPTTLIVDGVWGHALAEGPDARGPIAAETVSAALRAFVILPLVTAANVLIVQGLAEGRRAPAVGDALRDAARAFPRVAGAVIVYAGAVLGGTILLVLPGIWMAIAGYFAAQAAVVDDLPPASALRRSMELVRGAWWRTLGVVFAGAFVFLVAGSIVIGVFASTGSAALYVSALMVVGAAAVSLTALFATLLFYDLRARREPTPPPATMSA